MNRNVIFSVFTVLITLASYYWYLQNQKVSFQTFEVDGRTFHWPSEMIINGKVTPMGLPGTYTLTNSDGTHQIVEQKNAKEIRASTADWYRNHFKTRPAMPSDNGTSAQSFDKDVQPTPNMMTGK